LGYLLVATEIDACSEPQQEKGGMLQAGTGNSALRKLSQITGTFVRQWSFPMTPERVGSFEDAFKHGRTSFEGKGPTRMESISL
jgi:hypothetical protein